MEDLKKEIVLRTKDHTTRRVDFPELQHHWSAPEGNIRASWREVSLHRSLQLFVARTADEPFDISRGEARFYINPGETIPRQTRQNFLRYRAEVSKAGEFPSRLELEFSSPHDGPPSRPRAYRTLAIEWALSACDTVLICIDAERGRPEGEAHLVLAPVQLVFRSREEDVKSWVDYLQPRLKRRHQLGIVHPHIGVGRA